MNFVVWNIFFLLLLARQGFCEVADFKPLELPIDSDQSQVFSHENHANSALEGPSFDLAQEEQKIEEKKAHRAKEWANSGDDSYEEFRKRLIQAEQDAMVGSYLILNEKEKRVSKILFSEKQKEIDQGSYLPAKHFSLVLSQIEESKVFKIMKKLPKGANLHLHSQSIVEPRWLIQHATYLPECYMCVRKDASIRFHFFADAEKAKSSLHKDCDCAGCEWKNVNIARKAHEENVKDSSGFDDYLYSHMTLNSSALACSADDNLIWSKFVDALLTSDSLLAYHPVWVAYNQRALRSFSEDNIMYAEWRALLDDTYDIEGKIQGKVELLTQLQSLVKAEREIKPHFVGIKIIGCSNRNIHVKELVEKLHEASDLMQKFPDFYLGYDLVGREDTGQSLEHFHKYLDEFSDRSHLKFFFHGGETSWSGAVVDFNLFDAILLNATRIGHGLAFSKHPLLLDILKSRNIPIELNPVSNQVLGFVQDMRNHPGALYLKLGIPFVICSDDPAVWSIQGSSYDFYEAYMAFGISDLKFLKQMAINSFVYSGLTSKELDWALAAWIVDWNQFLDQILSEYSLDANQESRK
eukprot:Sdes_comp22723_c0_seq1m21137